MLTVKEPSSPTETSVLTDIPLNDIAKQPPPTSSADDLALRHAVLVLPDSDLFAHAQAGGLDRYDHTLSVHSDESESDIDQDGITRSKRHTSGSSKAVKEDSDDEDLQTQERTHRINTTSASRTISSGPLPYDQLRLDSNITSHPSRFNHSDARSFSQASLFDGPSSNSIKCKCFYSLMLVSARYMNNHVASVYPRDLVSFVACRGGHITCDKLASLKYCSIQCMYPDEYYKMA
ncbi:hypothetical protein SeMB42_g07549 [Synchytrium endobioticum]|uniref:Uncharacterized protein n=1 Tax=Synchytrium endobioticum TaxID=286115 RepID=A0A507BTV0_9FUNG|nr:hypothetical protein SeMB42_g07549 [Synchytrium endobioticum]TPX40712.1 hypothetical protein SeLEV6574_g06458 [Synchytrium endobioticum]